MNDSKYWLGFSLIPEIGPKRLFQLLRDFNDLERAWNAPEAELRRSSLEPLPLQNLLQHRRKIDLNQEMARVAQVGAALVTWDDSAYPALLRTLSDPPTLLYVRGTLTPEDERANIK